MNFPRMLSSKNGFSLAIKGRSAPLIVVAANVVVTLGIIWGVVLLPGGSPSSERLWLAAAISFLALAAGVAIAMSRMERA